MAQPATSAEPAAPSPGRAATSSPVETYALDPVGLLLFSVYLDDLTLSDGLGAFGDPADPLIPVSELARLLEADIDVLPPERRIIGRLGQARRSLVVDLTAGVARIGPKEVAIAREDTAVTPTEIYLRASTLQALLPLKIEIVPEDLALRLRATEKFPIQARLQRIANRPDGGQIPIAEPEALKVPQPYSLFSPPGFDVVVDGGFESGARNRDFSYDIRAAGDLFWSNFQAYLGSDEVGRASSARVLLQRRSVEGMLGGLRLREISAGDTYTPALSIGPRSVSGRGISLSTAPLEQTNIFNRIDLRGDLPPGYDVELFVNDVRKGSTDKAVNGRFEFLDVPLSPGLNVVRLVTYGPRGERSEEVQVINVGAALLRPREAQFRLGVVDQNTPVIRFGHSDTILGDPGLFADDGLRIVGALDYGVTDLLSVSAGVARIPRLTGGGLGVYTLGARTSILGLATQLDTGWDSRGGEAVSLGLAGQAGQVSAVLRHAEYRHGFFDENNLGLNSRLQMERRSELSGDANVNLRGRIVPVSLRLIRNGYADGSHDVMGAARASSSLGQVLFSAGFEYLRETYRPTPVNERLTGYLAASTFRSYAWQVRATLDYELIPDVRARFLTLTIDRRLNDLWSVRFGLGQPLGRRSDDWNVTASSVLSTRYGDFAVTGEYDNTDEDWRVAAQWVFGLGWDPLGRRYDLIRSGPGTGGSVLFNAFIDENGDGVRQAGEAPAPNVALGGGVHGARTGADGRVLVTGLGAGPSAHVDVNLDELADTSVSSPPQRLDLRPRPGSTARVDYPMRPTGGVMIKVELLRDDGQRVGLSSVRVQLLPPTGAPVEAVTEFDGSAMFDAIPTGRYHLQLDPRQAEKLRMRLLETPEIVIRGGGDFTPDVTVRVRFLPPATETSVARVGDGVAPP